MAGERQHINKLNKVRIITRTSNQIYRFEAYLTSNLQFGANNKYQEIDINSVLGSSGLASGLASTAITAAANIAGKAAAFDVPRLFSYRGSEPMKFRVSCALKLKTDPIKDLYEPLMRLAEVAYPSRSDASAASFLPEIKQNNGFDYDENRIEDPERQGITGGLSPRADSTWNRAEGALKSAKKPVLSIYNYLRQIGLLDIPVCQRLNTETWMLVGMKDDETIEIKNVIIKGFNVTMPKLVFDRGYPDRLDFSIDVESRRAAAVDIFENLLNTRRSNDSPRSTEQI